MHAIHPLQAPDRLGNPAIDFPIGMVFGDADFFGTEGADQIIKENRHFASGKSQLFKFEDCSHQITFDQPQKLVELMKGFFEGTVRGRFELKPLYEVAL